MLITSPKRLISNMSCKDKTAEEYVLDEYCQATCKGMGRCCDPQQCEGYRAEVEYTLEQWGKEAYVEQEEKT